MSISDRIKHLRDIELDIKQVEFAEAIHVSRSNLSNIESGRINPTDRVISDICDAFGVSETWLRTGEGEIFVPRTDEQEMSLIFGEALAEDGDPRRRKLLMSLINLVSNIPDEALPVVCEYAQQIADALKEDT